MRGIEAEAGDGIGGAGPEGATPGEGQQAPGAATKLVVVESPAKARTLQRFLGAGWTVRATGGHVRDLPPGRLAVDLTGSYTPDWQTVRGRGQVLQALAREARTAAAIYLATDPDREGEAIAWHVAEELGIEGRARRARIREITPAGIERALAEAGTLDRGRYEAHLARRVVDRIVGFRLAPLLGAAIRQGASAGRVQSLALRLLVERAQQRRAFRGATRLRVRAVLGVGRRRFEAICDARDRSEAEAAARAIEGGRPVVEQVARREGERAPPPPFVTATLQQEAFARLHFPLKKTMRLAQRLYEGVDLGPAGPVSLVTYARTDSPRVGARAREAARAFLAARLGAAALGADVGHAPPPGAQDAHEAIRPTAVELEPALVARHLDRDAARLYERIWRRFCASLLAPARYLEQEATIACGGVRLACAGAEVIAPGFLAILAGDAAPLPGESPTGASLAAAPALPPLEPGMELRLREVAVVEEAEEPPPPWDEASLLGALEARGIGRPSTWTQVIDTLVDRGYAVRVRGRLEPTELGEAVTGLLLQATPALVDPALTARLEAELEAIERGGSDWVEVVRRFHLPFEAQVEAAKARFGQRGRRGVVDRSCAQCGAAMAIRWGRNGPFLSCSTWPACRHTEDLVRPGAASALLAGEEAPALAPEAKGRCPRCGAALVERRGRSGPFLACSAYPACRATVPISTGVRCPACGVGEIAEKRSRRGTTFFGCNRYPACDHVMRERPVARPCPRCGAAWVVQRFSRRDGGVFACVASGCGHVEPIAAALARG